ncbi:MAG: tRNA dihydrouridine synthase DusB [Litorivicinaceae bacterium]|nr:tRNA dihydrouridine synthase DusB [Litorivicinaceae bacterium]
MRIGDLQFDNPVWLAPMAGVTDRPVRILARQLGAGMAVSEMVHADLALWNTPKSSRRLDHTTEPGPISMQIAGYDPAMLADAARAHVERGADIIDINLGCPAKKVLKKAAGSALMREEALVADIFRAVVKAVQVPVTVKMRTGWDHAHKNGPEIAKMAEALGLQAVTMHGRTRCDYFKGGVEYDTIRRTRDCLQIPLIANGDIDSAAGARRVLAETGADAVMIGRATQGNPWLAGQIAADLMATPISKPDIPTQVRLMADLVLAIHAFYGPVTGVKMARKHMCWFLARFEGGAAIWQQLCRETDLERQHRLFLAAAAEGRLACRRV